MATRFAEGTPFLNNLSPNPGVKFSDAGFFGSHPTAAESLMSPCSAPPAKRPV